MNLRQFPPILLVALLTLPAYSQSPALLEDGTPIRLQISRDLSSASAKVGENIEFQVLDEVKCGDVIVIPRGAVATATVTDARAKASGGRDGHVDLHLRYVRAVNGEKVPLRGAQYAEANSQLGARTGLSIATGVAFAPAGPLVGLIKGKDATIPKGQEATAYIDGDFSFDSVPANLQTSISVPDQPQATRTLETATTKNKPLTNVDIINFKNAGFADDFIIGQIRTEPGKYSLRTSDVQELKTDGISDEAISAMAAVVNTRK